MRQNGTVVGRGNRARDATAGVDFAAGTARLAALRRCARVGGATDAYRYADSSNISDPCVDNRYLSGVEVIEIPRGERP